MEIMSTNSNEFRYLGLVSGTALYIIGAGFSKILNFIILPYISVMISSEQLGEYDAIQTLAGLLVPIITLQAIDAAFRFMFEADDDEKRKVLTNVWFILLVGISSFIVVGGIFNILLKLNYFWLLIGHTISNILVNMFQRIARSYDLRKEYAISGILNTVLLLLFQFLFLKFTELNEKGLVYSYIFAAIITCIYLEFKSKSIKHIHFEFVEGKIIRKILYFSVPLIPNSISWWGVSSVGRIIIIAYLGYTANGIYSMSNKFAGLVTTITSTFLLAFQEYALSKCNRGESQGYSIVFKHYIHLLSVGTALLLLLQQVYFSMFIDTQYSESTKYIPIVMIGMFFSAISSFYGTGYFVYERTRGALKTTIVGACINIVMSFFFIQPLGLWGVAVATALAYFVVFIWRHLTMRSYFKIVFDKRYIVIGLVIIVSSIVVFYNNNIFASIFMILGILIYVSLFYKRYVLIILAKLKRGDANDDKRN